MKFRFENTYCSQCGAEFGPGDHGYSSCNEHRTKRRNPTPTEIRAARESVGLSQTEAAALIHSGLRAWQGWEAPEGNPDHRRMHLAMWELFLIKAGIGLDKL